MGNACSSETVTSPIVFAWAHAGRVCPVLTTGGAVGLTEGPKTPATSLPQENQMEGSATEDLLPGNPQKVMHQEVSPWRGLYWPRMGSSLTSGGRLRRNTPCCVRHTCSTMPSW